MHEHENSNDDQKPDYWLPTLILGLLMMSTLSGAFIILFFFHTK